MEEMHFKYVILGGGVASGYAAKEFVEQGLQPGELAIISKESVAPYERPALSKQYLYIDDPPDIHVCPLDWYAKQGIELILNTAIIKANLASKTLISEIAQIFTYDILIIATGCTSMKLCDWGCSEEEPKNVFYLRDTCQAEELRELIKAKKGGKCVIGGSPYISLEIAAAMKMNRFEEVSIHFPEPWIMPMLFMNPAISDFYESYYATKGVKVIKGATISRFSSHPNGEVKEVILSDGTVLDADVVVLLLYDVPVVSLFYGQVEIEKGGVKIDGNCRTSIPDVYAIGDVAAFSSKMYNKMRRVEHADHARKSAQHAVKAIKASEQGETIDPYDYLPHISFCAFDLSWVFCGDNGGDVILFEDTSSTLSKPKFGAYWIKDEKIVGAFLEGGTPEENKAIAKVARTQPEVADIIDWLEVEGLDFACNI